MTGSLAEIARRVRTGAVSAIAVTQAALHDIELRDPLYRCFTRVFKDQALSAARLIDQQIAAGVDPGPLAGAPFAVKDLFDVEGVQTTAGSVVLASEAPAARDAEVVSRLKRAGAVLLGTLNMDEFAYGFATVNAHFGVTRNPADVERLAGGSSGGSAAAVAAGFVPLTLGSDTNGSVRVPASLCGVWGLRPAEGAIPLEGVFPFAETLDTAGPFTRSLADLALVYGILSDLPAGVAPAAAPRIARLGGWFARSASLDAVAAVDQVMASLGAADTAELPEAEAARSAAFLITAAEGGALHKARLAAQAMDYDPEVRDRLLAGALLPAAVVASARAYRTHYRKRIEALFETHDILVAAATPVTAPRFDEPTFLVDGKPASARANLGLYAQPLSLAGAAIVSAPVNRPGRLPIGVQFAVAPGREAMLFQLLARLEAEGVLSAFVPQAEMA